MGNGKISPLVIVVLMIILAGVAFVAVRIMSGQSAIPGINDKNDKEAEKALIIPAISFELSSEEENQEEVLIKVKAQVDHEDGIDHIILPDGTKIEAPEAEYTVTENGTYKFQASSVAGGKSESEIKITNIRLISADNPYIPDGFKYVGGDVDSGYVISDNYGNEYVWIPCPKGLLKRDTLLDTAYSEASESATALVNSVAKYYGFYMGRYEASAYDTGEGLVAATKEGAIPWTEVTYIDAANAAKVSGQYFGYPDDIITNMQSSYAWDTVLAWLDEKTGEVAYSSSKNYGNFGGTIKPTGTTTKDQVNNIYDMAGNVREWTTEIYKGTTSTKKSSSSKKNQTAGILTRVVRGGSANLARTPAAHTAYEENTSEPYWGFRLVMYKN